MLTNLERRQTWITLIKFCIRWEGRHAGKQMVPGHSCNLDTEEIPKALLELGKMASIFPHLIQSDFS